MHNTSQAEKNTSVKVHLRSAHEAATETQRGGTVT